MLVLNNSKLLEKLISSSGKSDRINALRKQYDAFLEEDKKRKERNQYILGRLDKMRVCTAVVPLRHKPNQLDCGRPSYHTSPSQLIPIFGHTTTDQQRSPLDLSTKLLDESDILKEISKKYILIPKTRINNEVLLTKTFEKKDPIKQDVEMQNADWKSKYEILEQLKELEKEEPVKEKKLYIPPVTTAPQNNSTVAINTNNIPSNIENNCNNYESNYEPFPQSLDQQNFSPNHKVPIGVEHTEYDEQTLSQMQSESYRDANILPENNDNFKNQDYIEENVSYIQNQPYPNTEQRIQNIETQDEYQVDNSVDPYKDEAVVQDEYITQQNFQQEDNTASYHDGAVNQEQYLPSEENIEDNIGMTIDDDKVNNVQQIINHGKNETISSKIKEDDVVQEINEYQTSDIPKAIPEYEENKTYPVDTINTPDFTQNDNVTLSDGININPQDKELSQDNFIPSYESNTLENLVSEPQENSTADINSSRPAEFETDQKEMYQPEGHNVENETVASNDNTDYTTQNENYEGNYYEGQQEQNYPVELNEHQETTETYDQNYAAQYANQYDPQHYPQEGYEQGNYDQNAQQYDQTNGEYGQSQEGYQEYEQTQPMYDQGQPGYQENEEYQLQYEQNYETQENMEQQLDYEQGYIPAEQQQEEVPIANNETDKVVDKVPIPQSAM